ncbi:MAG: hypothetical protein ACLTYN_13935 [Dysosmobacter welbionis]
MIVVLVGAYRGAILGILLAKECSASTLRRRGFCNMEEARRCLVFDPRVGLALLVFANLAAFSEQPFWMEMIWIGFLLLLMLLHRCFAMVGKSILIFGESCACNTGFCRLRGWVATSFLFLPTMPAE